jgi:UDP-N-acetylglucosamine acyltransferase
MTKIHPSAVVDKEAILGDDVVVGPHCVIEAGAQVGSGTRLHAGAVIGVDTVVGEGNILHNHCVIGGRPQILGWGDDVVCGGLVVGDRNVFREYVTIHRSMYPHALTRIGSENLIMVGSHIGHDCQLEDQTVLSNACQIGGHSKIESGCWMSGMSGTHQFVTVGKWAYSAAMTAIVSDVPPFLMISGNYPFRVRGVNHRGIKRAGLDDTVAGQICDAYRRLYRGGGTLLGTARQMMAEGGHPEAVLAMLETIERSSQHRYGRYLETFR